MTAARETASDGWRKFGALLLGAAAVGLPINHVATYALLAIFAVMVLTGETMTAPRRWFAAVAFVAVAAVGQAWWAPPLIEEGHNLFLPGAGAQQRELPPAVYQHMAAEFDKLYPPEVRCRQANIGCWQDGGVPEKAYAFSADGIWHKSAASRTVTTLDFADPIWLHLGFINDSRYNWTSSAPDVHRADRDRRFFMGWRRWHLAMPWFEMARLPAAYVGGQLCWRGDVLWEDSHGFSTLPAEGCRQVTASDVDHRVFGIAIRPDTLAMNLKPPWSVWLKHIAADILTLAALIALVLLLAKPDPRRMVVPLILLGLAALVIAIDDMSFLGGVRPFDGGDDGLFYDGVGRVILQKLVAGDFWGALEGGEKVFYYGGPGLRYFRALEHIVFGESYLGYLSVVLSMPCIVWLLFRRFLPGDWAVGLAIVFVAIPIGMLFGTSFANYVKWAGRGFADPMAYILFIGGVSLLVGASVSAPSNRFAPAFFAALLFALGICMKPIVAPAAAVLLGGAGLAALYHRQLARLAGLCFGFLPVFSMILHNWVYGRVLVLFSTNFDLPQVLVMPPSAYVEAVRGLSVLDFSGLREILVQLMNWLSGPAQSYLTVPLNAAAVAILVYVVARGRAFDPWLRLIGAAALAQHAVALFYIGTVARYHFLAGFLTMVVVLVWFHRIGIAWLCRRYPAPTNHMAASPTWRRLASGLTRLQKMSA